MVDKNITTYVPIYKNITKEIEVEKIVDNTTVLKTGYELWHILLIICAGLILYRLIVYTLKSTKEVKNE